MTNAKAIVNSFSYTYLFLKPEIMAKPLRQIALN